jgi:hypothetical protein
MYLSTALVATTSADRLREAETARGGRTAARPRPTPPRWWRSWRPMQAAMTRLAVRAAVARGDGATDHVAA